MDDDERRCFIRAIRIAGVTILTGEKRGPKSPLRLLFDMNFRASLCDLDSCFGDTGLFAGLFDSESGSQLQSARLVAAVAELLSLGSPP
jgi:hypothetical protein